MTKNKKIPLKDMPIMDVRAISGKSDAPMLEYDIFIECEFCGVTILKSKYEQHADFCARNPQAKQRKRRKPKIDKNLYDFTKKEYFENHTYGSTKTVTYVYSRKYTSLRKGDAGYRSLARNFGLVLRVLCREGFIEKYNGQQYKKIG